MRRSWGTGNAPAVPVACSPTCANGAPSGSFCASGRPSAELLAGLEGERPQGRPTWGEFFGFAVAPRRVSGDAARWAQARAVGTAQRRGRQLQEQRVAQEWFEVDDVDIELVRLARQRVRLEQLVDVDVEVTFDGSKAPAARSLPARMHGAADD